MRFKICLFNGRGVSRLILICIHSEGVYTVRGKCAASAVWRFIAQTLRRFRYKLHLQRKYIIFTAPLSLPVCTANFAPKGVNKLAEMLVP